VVQGVVLIPSIIFISCIFFNYFRFWVLRKTFEDYVHPRIHPRVTPWSSSETILQPKLFLQYHRRFWLLFCTSS